MPRDETMTPKDTPMADVTVDENSIGRQIASWAWHELTRDDGFFATDQLADKIDAAIAGAEERARPAGSELTAETKRDALQLLHALDSSHLGNSLAGPAGVEGLVEKLTAEKAQAASRGAWGMNEALSATWNNALDKAIEIVRQHYGIATERRAVTSERWIETWYGSPPARGSSIWAINEYGKRTRMLIHIGDTEKDHALTTRIVALHNDTIATPLPASPMTREQRAEALELMLSANNLSIKFAEKHMAKALDALLSRYELIEGKPK